MRLRRDKTAYAVGRPSWRSSFLGDPGARFLCGKRERGTKKEKSSKKERKEGLWKLTLLMEIRKERGFPQQLEKSLAKDARLFHSSHRPNNTNLSIMYRRQRSTLRRLHFSPKDGEHLREDHMLEGAEKTKSGGQISPPLGYACWGQQMETDLGVDPAGTGLAQDHYAWLIRED